MYIILYRYKIRKKDLAKRKKIMKACEKILNEYGINPSSKKDITLFKHGKTITTIVETIHYKSESAFKKEEKRAKQDPKMKKIHEEFDKILYGKMEEEIFDTK